jgi:hypothetical protein
MVMQALIDAKMIHAIGTDPHGLGMMQPEGRPQLYENEKTIHTVGTDPHGLGMMQPEGRPQLNENEKCHLAPLREKCWGS